MFIWINCDLTTDFNKTFASLKKKKEIIKKHNEKLFSLFYEG